MFKQLLFCKKVEIGVVDLVECEWFEEEKKCLVEEVKVLQQVCDEFGDVEMCVMELKFEV